MPNSSAFIFLMYPALYMMVCKNSKKCFAKKSLNVPNVKQLSKKISNVFSLFMHFCWVWHLALCTLSDFPGIRNLSGLNDLNSLNNLSGLNDLNSLISSKNLLSLTFPSILAPNWPIMVSQCGIIHQKSHVLLIFDTLSVGGCGGHECYF